MTGIETSTLRAFVFNPYYEPESLEPNITIIPPHPANIMLTEVEIFDSEQRHPANIMLTELEISEREQRHNLGKRHTKQSGAIRKFNERLKARNPDYQLELPGDPASQQLREMFAPTLDWAYRCFEVRDSACGVKPKFQRHLYLFNILVAFEWEPGPENFDVIERAAQRASDFLFDVTDGWMAIGQVVIGGPALMDFADIQVMASNRLHPRSWIGGLHEPKKYMPIRLGRGLWRKNNRFSIAWDEPEGYRSLIHEWAHYALELWDAYLETHQVYMSDGTKSNQRANQGRRANQDLVVPTISLAVESIMSTLEGTSELVAKQTDDPILRKKSEWDIIRKGFQGTERKTPRFPRICEIFNPREGPLPLRELPHIARVIPTAKNGRSTESELLLFNRDLPLDIEPEHCWVYILRYKEEQAEEQAEPEGNQETTRSRVPKRIIAQGTLEGNTRQDAFQIFGARKGDTIILIGNGPDWNERVKSTRIVDIIESEIGKKSKQIKVGKWRDRTPVPNPVIDVLPGPVTVTTPPSDIRTSQIKVRVSKLDDGRLRLYDSTQISIYVFPLDRVVANDQEYSDDPIKVAQDELTDEPISLDGHVLVQFKDGDGLMIVTYSQGGGPETGSPVGHTPITPGSSEGNLMIFFADRGEYPEKNLEHREIRVVTTRLAGMPPTLENGIEARGYAFSLGGNAALPPKYLPTLVLSYDKRTELEDGEPRIFRLNNTGIWEAIPSYRPRGAWYVAAPLNLTTAPCLFAPDRDDMEPRAERYRLYWVPRDTPAKT